MRCTNDPGDPGAAAQIAALAVLTRIAGRQAVMKAAGNALAVALLLAVLAGVGVLLDVTIGMP